MSDTLLRTPHFPSTPNRLYTALIHEAHRKGEHKKDQDFQLFLYIIEMGETGTNTSLILPSVLQVSSPKSKFFCLFMPRDSKVQVYNYLILMSPNLYISFKVSLLYVLLNKTQLTFLPPTHKEVQEFHISRKLPAR